MNYFSELLKINIKLLLRNKGFLFFLFITPLISVIIMNLKVESSLYENTNENAITDVSPGEKIVYINDYQTYSIKVYDGAYSKLSEYMLKSLAECSIFSVYRQDARNLSPNEVLRQAKEEAMNDRIGAVLYLKPDFSENILKGSYKDALIFYQVSDDERWELLNSHFKGLLYSLQNTSNTIGADEEGIISALAQIKKVLPEKEIISLDGKNEIALTKEQGSKMSLAGYAYSIMTLGFLFCGVCIAHTVIEERENKVYTRIMLSKSGKNYYLLSKYLMSVFISLLQTGELAIYMFLLKKLDWGIPKTSALLFIFLLGLIFNLISLQLGILIGDVMGTNYAAFAIWSVSSLLSGLYFPIEGSSDIIKALSHFMPQKWFINGTKLLMVNDSSAYAMIGCVTAAYLIIIFCIGAVGLKMKVGET